ncbi:MAG: ABC transporter permease [Bacilli bacterium]|nr:ABC transporter permease [Bacilli bacterium]
MSIIAFIQQAIRFATIFLFGSTGESITERSGHLNLGVPGIMCVGSAGAALGAKLYLTLVDSCGFPMNGFFGVLFPVLFCLICGALAGLMFCFFTATLKANQNVVGLSMTTFGIGLYVVIFQILGESGYTRLGGYFTKVFFDSVSASNWFELLFLSYGPLVYLAIIVSIIAGLIIRKTKLGLTLRSVGENPSAADATGINVQKYRYVATIIGSAIAALGGCFLFMDYMAGQPLYNIDTYGWMAVALVIFVGWNPDLGVLGSFLFAAAYILPDSIKIDSKNPLIEIVRLLPYFLTIIILIISSVSKTKLSNGPKALGVTYFREDR